MKTKLTSFILAGLTLGAAILSFAGPGPQYWQGLRRPEQFQELKPGDKVLYVCNQCKTVTEQTITSTEQAMEHCKDGAILTCPACKAKVKVSLQGPPKNPITVREIILTNDKGDECFFVAKRVDQK